MDYSALISVKNLELAWRRITTGQNMQYKRFFRPLYAAYEPGLADNLKLLHQRLRGSWRATPPDRLYLPKPSGLQRPITLLGLEDQIVLQAVANAFAEKLADRRRQVAHGRVFSNWLSADKDSIFFLQDWRRTYRRFEERTGALFQRGYCWVGFFDLAAFYDTISHELLERLVSPRRGHPRTWHKVASWLKTWSAEQADLSYDHGIPQGPIAADWLAECFLLPIDESMVDNGFGYIRYVDDIRILAKSPSIARQAIVRLEIQCRKRGLIPQSAKCDLFEATTIDEALRFLPSLAAPNDEAADDRPSLSAPDAESIFRGALSGRPLRIVDKTKARYALYRAPRSRRLAKWVARLLPQHPEHTDAMMAYLANFERSAAVERVAAKMLMEGIPYDYVRGELWRLLARIARPQILRELRPLCLSELVTRPAVSLSWGAYCFLLACEKQRIGRCPRRVAHQHPLVQALLVSHLPDSEFRRSGIVRDLLAQDRFEPGIVLAEQLAARQQTHRAFGLTIQDLAPQVQNVFRGVGLIGRRGQRFGDPVGDLLVRRFGVPATTKWRPLLRGEYTHALHMLLEAEAAFDPGPSRWLQMQNSFNDSLFRALQARLQEAGRPEALRTVGKDGRLVKFGSLLEPANRFSTAFPEISEPLRRANDRRNHLPDSHAYDEKTGARNTYLRKAEQRALAAALAASYAAMPSLVRAPP